MAQKNTAASRKKAPKVDELQERLNDALKLTILAHVSAAAGMHPTLVQNFANGGAVLTELERKHLEKGLACFAKK